MALDRPVHAPETVDGTAAPAAHGDLVQMFTLSQQLILSRRNK
jgi:hypothetical protein